MRPINPRICAALEKAAGDEPLDDAERRQVAALSKWIKGGCLERGMVAGQSMTVPKNSDPSRVPEPWETDDTLTGLVPLVVEEKAAKDILLTEPASSEYHLGGEQIVQYGPDMRF